MAIASLFSTSSSTKRPFEGMSIDSSNYKRRRCNFHTDFSQRKCMKTVSLQLSFNELPIPMEISFIREAQAPKPDPTQITTISTWIAPSSYG